MVNRKIDKERANQWRLWFSSVKNIEKANRIADINKMIDPLPMLKMLRKEVLKYVKLKNELTFYHVFLPRDDTDVKGVDYVAPLIIACYCRGYSKYNPSNKNFEKILRPENIHYHTIIGIDKNIAERTRQRYFANYYGAGTWNLRKIKNINHFLNVLIYFLGRNNHNGLPSHQPFTWALTDKEKKILYTKTIRHKTIKPILSKHLWSEATTAKERKEVERIELLMSRNNNPVASKRMIDGMEAVRSQQYDFINDPEAKTKYTVSMPDYSSNKWSSK
jgi:hypothetical protein